jgi:hypothetical protein
MAELKTRPTKASVTSFLNSIEDSGKRRDAKKVAAMMRRSTGARARMWGPGIVGYGTYSYTNSSNKECEFMLTGYSPRKQALTVYIMPGFSGFKTLMKKLGKHTTGKSCLYIKRLDDVDEDVLEELIDRSVRQMKTKYDVK